MTQKAVYHPDRFDLRDSYWEFLSIREGELIARVNDVNILTGEGKGQVIDTATVTFRGFHLEWGKLIQGEELIPIPLEKVPEILAEEPYFVFSYCADDHECELAGLAEKAVAMLFTFDSAEITWEDHDPESGLVPSLPPCYHTNTTEEKEP